MMASAGGTNFSDFIESELFTFNIGKEKKPFIVHSQAVASTSQHFNALLNGEFAEAQNRAAHLEDVEPEDFMRFVEYAYRHDYTVPSWTLDEAAIIPKVPESNGLAPDMQVDEPVRGDIEEPPPPPPPEPPLEDEPWGYSSISVKKAKKKAKMQTVRTVLAARVYFEKDATPNAHLTRASEPQANTEATQDFTPIFLAHARLYTFAEERLVDPLKNLALSKLHATLMKFSLYTVRVRDIIALAEYAYSTGPDRGKSGAPNELRQLIVEYIAAEVETIGGHALFTEFLEQGGEFASDFWGTAMKYLI